MKVKYRFFAALFGMLFLAVFLCSLPKVTRRADAATTGDFTTPATVTKVTEETLSTLVDHRADGKTVIEMDNGKTYTPLRETYAPQDRQWQGTPSVACLGKRIWCAWQTGDSGEPRIFNYIVVAYSDDDGETWVDPFIVIDHPGEDVGVYVTCPSFYKNSKGNLCLNFGQYGTWTVEFYNADAENIDDVTWSEPFKMSNSRCAKAPIKVVDGDGKNWLMYVCESEAGDNHPTVTRVWASEDDGKTWKVRAAIPSSCSSNPSKRTCAESNIAQTSDGTLIVASRIEDGYAGGVEVSYSYDYGLTWTKYQNNLEEPYIGPGSKFHLELLPSGNLLMVNHATTSTRENLKIYLSEDNGKTWPYTMTLDGRSDVTYPYVFANGDKIYITWDKGRYLEKEIRVSVLTEADIKAGKVVSEGSKTMLKVSKLNPDYKEIVSIKTKLDRKMSFALGTESSEIRKKLPAQLVVTDNTGAEHTLTGVWKCKGYDANKEGSQVFTFDAEMPAGVADNYNLLSVEVTLGGKATHGGKVTKGCGANFTFGTVGISLTALLATFAIFAKKRRWGRK